MDVDHFRGFITRNVFTTKQPEKDKDGNIFVKPKDGSGPGDPTGEKING